MSGSLRIAHQQFLDSLETVVRCASKMHENYKYCAENLGVSKCSLEGVGLPRTSEFFVLCCFVVVETKKKYF